MRRKREPTAADVAKTRAKAKRAAAKRARRKKGSDLTAAQWRWLKEWTGERCFYCWTKPERLEKDCVIPLRSGGKYTLMNVVPACPKCNHDKGGKKLATFMKRYRLDADVIQARFEKLWAAISLT